jgi:hypothetical protein
MDDGFVSFQYFFSLALCLSSLFLHSISSLASDM